MFFLIDEIDCLDLEFEVFLLEFLFDFMILIFEIGMIWVFFYFIVVLIFNCICDFYEVFWCCCVYYWIDYLDFVFEV